LRPAVAALRREWSLALTIATAAAFLVFGHGWLADFSSLAWFGLVTAWLFAVIMVAALAIVRHAEGLAAKFGEPLGTLILTLAVTGVEVTMITAVMYAGHGNAALGRDTMFAVVMIVLNGMVGLSLLLGGLRYREQTYNLQGANAYLAVIVPLSVLGLVLPDYTVASPGPTFSPLQSCFLIVMSLGLYAVFLVIQNLRHRDYFIAPETAAGPASDSDHSQGHAGHEVQSVAYHSLFLAVNLLFVVFLSEQIAVPINFGIHVLRAPAALGGFFVSVLVLSPESLSAVRAALANQLQRSVNLLLGSVLASISLTIPAVLAIGFLTHQNIILGLDSVDTILLILTLAVSMMTFASPRTNVLLGAVHLLLFLAYLMLIFEH
jgi:Ca2+:H+ antiporter